MPHGKRHAPLRLPKHRGRTAATLQGGAGALRSGPRSCRPPPPHRAWGRHDLPAAPPCMLFGAEITALCQKQTAQGFDKAVTGLSVGETRKVGGCPGLGLGVGGGLAGWDMGRASSSCKFLKTPQPRCSHLACVAPGHMFRKCAGALRPAWARRAAYGTRPPRAGLAPRSHAATQAPRGGPLPKEANSLSQGRDPCHEKLSRPPPKKNAAAPPHSGGGLRRARGRRGHHRARGCVFDRV